MTKTDELNYSNFFSSDRTAKYDREIALKIPGYHALHEMTHDLLRTSLSEVANLLIVGAGTGMEILHMAAENPQWRFSAVDPAASMLDAARQKFTEAGLSDTVNLHVGYVEDLPKSTELYDAATLLLVLHFIPDDGSKLLLLQQVAQRLKPGAPLIMANIVGDRYSAKFEQFIAASKSRQIRLGLPTEEIAIYFQNMRETLSLVTEERNIELLTQAGFDEIHRFYTAYLFEGWIAKLRNST